MIGIILFFIVFFFLACGIKFLFDLKIEIAMFVGICLITIIIALSALLGILNIGVNIAFAVAVLSFAFCVYYIIKNRSEIKQLVSEVFSPGMIILILAYIIYFIVIRDKVLVYRDEATSWVLEIKHMFTLGVYKSYSPHNNILGFLSYFMTRITGYSEPVIFMSRWFFIWVCVILPIADLTWKDWIKAFIYAIGAYCIISAINSAPVYYMDLPLGLLAGVLCARWSISKTNIKDYIWLYAGLIILINIKDELGLVITGLCILYFTICNIIRYVDKPNQERKINKLSFALNTGLFMSFIVIFIQSNFADRITYMFSGFSVKFLLLLTGGIFAIAILLYLIKRFGFLKYLKKHSKIIIALIIVIVCLVGYKAINIFYSGLSYDLQKVFVNAINSLYNKGYFGRNVYILVGLAAILVAVMYILLLKQRYAKAFSIQSITIFIMIFIYSLALVFGYVFEPIKEFRDNLANLHRYYGPIIILGAIWLLSRILDNDMEYKKDKSAIIVALVVMSVLIKEMPAPGNIMYNNMEKFRYSVTYGLRNDLREDSKLISNNEECEKVLIIAQPENNKWDVFSAIAWIRYEILPIDARGTIISDNASKFYDGKLSTVISKKELAEAIKINEYSHVYVYSADKYLFKAFGDLFEPNGGIMKKILYKVTPESDYLLSFVEAGE